MEAYRSTDLLNVDMRDIPKVIDSITSEEIETVKRTSKDLEVVSSHELRSVIAVRKLKELPKRKIKFALSTGILITIINALLFNGIEYFLQKVVVMRVFLHVLGRTFHVHDDVGHSQSGNGGKHLLVHVAGRDVVDNSCSIFFYAHLCDVGTECVDGNNGVGIFFVYQFQAPAQTLHFFFAGDMLGVRTR